MICTSDYKSLVLRVEIKMLKTTTECLAAYGSRYLIAEAVKRGELRKVAKGVYSDGSRHREIEILQIRYPSSVVTMLSAYHYYGLTDTIPDKCHLAVERGGSKIRSPNVVEYFVPEGTGQIGVENLTLRGVPLRIFDRERLLIETARLRTKIPPDLYHEVIDGFRRITGELYPAKMEDYLESFPKRDAIFEVIRREVL